MSKMPIAAPQTEGRIFGTDWSIANVATLLRSNAARGVWRHNGTTGGYTAKLNQNYIRTVSARHLPTSVTKDTGGLLGDKGISPIDHPNGGHGYLGHRRLHDHADAGQRGHGIRKLGHLFVLHAGQHGERKTLAGAGSAIAVSGADGGR